MPIALPYSFSLYSLLFVSHHIFLRFVFSRSTHRSALLSTSWLLLIQVSTIFLILAFMVCCVIHTHQCFNPRFILIFLLFSSPPTCLITAFMFCIWLLLFFCQKSNSVVVVVVFFFIFGPFCFVYFCFVFVWGGLGGDSGIFMLSRRLCFFIRREKVSVYEVAG